MRPKENVEIIQKVLSPRVLGKMLVQIGLIVGAIILAAVFAGKYLDGVFNTTPWLAAAFAVGSTLPAFYITYKLGRRAISQSNAEFEKWETRQQAPDATGQPEQAG